MKNQELYERIATIRTDSKRALIKFVLCITLLCTAGATLIDVVIRLIYFLDVQVALNDAVFPVLITPLVALPTAYYFGRQRYKLQQAFNRLELIADFDSMTGLLQAKTIRRHFVEAGRADGVIMLVDIDGLRQHNMLMGHDFGDRIIIRVATILADELSDIGSIYRICGDTFAFLASGGSQTDVEGRAAAAIDRVARTAFSDGRRSTRVAISIGIAPYFKGTPFEQAFARGEMALADAQLRGHGQLHILGSTKQRVHLVEIEEIGWSSGQVGGPELSFSAN